MYTKIDETIILHGLNFDVMVTPKNAKENGDEYLFVHIFSNDRRPEEPGGEYEYQFTADALAEALGVPHEAVKSPDDKPGALENG